MNFLNHWFVIESCFRETEYIPENKNSCYLPSNKLKISVFEVDTLVVDTRCISESQSYNNRCRKQFK